MTYYEAIGRRFQEILADNNLSIYELHMRSQVPKSTVYRTVNAKNIGVTIETVNLLCKGLDMDIKEFFASDLFSSKNIDK